MSIEQPEFEIDIEIDADLDRKADELIKVFQDDYGDVDYDNVVNSLLEKSNDAVLSNDINYKARLYNMLFRKTNTKHLSLTSVDNYKARLYALALKKIKLSYLSIEGTHGLDDAALLVDWVRKCNSLSDLYLKSIKNEGVLCEFIQAAKANPGIDHINIKESHLTRKVIQTILEEMRIEKEFHVDPCLLFGFEDDRDTVIRIKHINDELPTDLVTLLTNTIRYDNQDNGSKINIEDSLLTPSVIQTILDKKRYDNQDNGSLIKKEFHVDRNSDVLYEYEPEEDDETSSGAVIPTRAESPIVETDSVDMDCDDRNDRNDNSGGIVSNLVTGVSSGMTAVNEVGSDYLENKYDEANAVHLPAEEVCFIPCPIPCPQEKVFHVDTCLEFRFKRNRNNDKLPTDLTKPIQNCTNLKKFRCDSISNDRNDLLLLDAVVANTKIEEIEIEMSPISEVIIPMILNESKSLKVLKVGQLETDYSANPYAFEWHSDGNRGSFFDKYPAISHLSMCGFSLDCSELVNETVSIEYVDNRTIPFYVQALTKRRFTELEIISDNGLDDGSLLIEWIKHSGSLKKFRCCSVDNEVVCRELLEAAVSNPNVEHLYLEGKCMRFLSNVLNQSKSLRCLEIDERGVPVMWYNEDYGMSQANEFPLFEKESLSRLFKRENKHAQSRSNIEKLVLHCGYHEFENVGSFLKENGAARTFFNTVELKLNEWFTNLPTMRGVHELEIPIYYECFDPNVFFIAMRKNFCLRRLNLIHESDESKKLLEFQNDINMLCKRNETIQNWADVGYSIPKQYLYRTLSICQMYEFSQEIIFDLLKKYWCCRSDHVFEANKSTNCSSSDKIQRKRKRKET